jgi:hypothetical protein
MPIAIVAGGPERQIDRDLEAVGRDVNGGVVGPHLTVPEKFSVTSGDEGAVGSVVDVSLEWEHAAAVSAVATIRQAKVRFVHLIRERLCQNRGGG